MKEKRTSNAQACMRETMSDETRVSLTVGSLRLFGVRDARSLPSRRYGARVSTHLVHKRLHSNPTTQTSANHLQRLGSGFARTSAAPELLGLFPPARGCQTAHENFREAP